MKRITLPLTKQIYHSNKIDAPRLIKDLEHILFNPGVHFFRDPRTKVYNFKPHNRFITPLNEFNFDAIKPFVPPASDNSLSELAQTLNMKFVGSTSSCSSALSQIYFFISKHKNPSLKNLLASGEVENEISFTKRTKLPSSILLYPKTIKDSYKVYSINYDKLIPEDEESVLSKLGKSLELFLTKPIDEYSLYLKKNAKSENPSTILFDEPESFSYCQHGSLFLRSQLDASNPYLPRKTFDLKTRATLAIRMNMKEKDEYLNCLDYKLFKLYGNMNSFEREYLDMIRTAFLKYNFQVRIGNMDGIFVAYHNTNEIFGYQYIPRETMDDIIFGGIEKGNEYFSACLDLFNYIVDNSSKLWPDDVIRILFDTTSPSKNLDVYVEKIDDPNNLEPGINSEPIILYRISLKSSSVGSWQKDKSLSYNISQQQIPLKTFSSSIKKATSFDNKKRKKFCLKKYFTSEDKSENMIFSRPCLKP